MFSIDMGSLRPVGEFGSEAWCKACADYGMQILAAADLPEDLVWGFSEIYTDPPARLLSDQRLKAGYYFMVENGEISGGDGVTEGCLALPGFHVQMSWGFLCNQSRTLYGSAGQKQRSAEEQVLREAMEAFLGHAPDLGGIANPVWPQPIIAALSVGSEEGAGLHNIAATLQMPSPEFADLPVTEMGVPVFADMDAEQKQAFVRLCGVGPAD